MFGMQLVYAGNINNAKEQQLQRLCANITSTVDLAGARVKVNPCPKFALHLPPSCPSSCV